MITQLHKRGTRKRDRAWFSALKALLSLTANWAENAGWRVEREPLVLAEQTLGHYETEVLHIHIEKARLDIEPIGCSVPQADGRVDLCAYPTLHRVRLLRKGAGWVVRTESGIDWPKPWNRETFLELARQLATAH